MRKHFSLLVMKWECCPVLEITMKLKSPQGKMFAFGLPFHLIPTIAVSLTLDVNIEIPYAASYSQLYFAHSRMKLTTSGVCHTYVECTLLFKNL